MTNSVSILFFLKSKHFIQRFGEKDRDGHTAVLHRADLGGLPIANS